MKVTLWDMDMPYEIQNDVNAEGQDFIRIMPNSMAVDREEETYDLCLDYNCCLELIDALKFMSKKIKPKRQ